MRKIIQICSLLFLFTIATYAQNTSVTIDSVNAATIGQKLTVPVRVSNFNNMLAVTLSINYDPAVVQFDSISGQSDFFAGASGGKITITRAGLSAVSPANGTLLNLHFTYSGGSSGLTFNTAQNELVSTTGTVAATYTGGAIVNPTSTVGLDIQDVTAGAINSEIAVPINVTNFTNIGAVTLKINYDPAVAQFDSVTSGFFGGASGGVVTITRAQVTAIPAAGGELLRMYFKYKGGSSALTFGAGNEVVSLTSGVVTSLNLSNGNIAANPAVQLSLQVGTVTPSSVGGTFAVPVTVDNFSNIGALTLKVQYDPAVATFDSVSSAGGYFAGASGGVITVTRAGVSAIVPDSGKIFDLYFRYFGGSSNLTINTAQTEIVNLTTGVVPTAAISFTNGRINANAALTVALGLGSVTGTIGSEVAVPLVVDNFNNIGAVTLKINYNPALVQFDSVSRASEFFAGASGGVLTITRAGTNPVSPDSGNLFNIYFKVLAAGTANLNFNTAASEIVHLTAGVITNVTYTNGVINIAAGEPVTVSLANVLGGNVNSEVAVPLTVDNFTNIGAVTLKINYNPAVAQFDSVSRGSEFLAGAAGGVVTITRAALDAVVPDSGKVLDVYFKYLGGSTNLAFDAAASEIVNRNSGPIAGVNYVNGSIAGGNSVTVKLDSVTAAVNSTVAVPVRVTNFSNVGAFTFKINYDPAVARFDSASGQSSMFTGAAGGVITIARASTTPVTPTNGKILDLYFTYLGGSTNLTFNAGASEVADLTTGAIAGVIYIGGRISANTAPMFTAELTSRTIAEGDTLRFDYNATDPEGGAVYFRLVTPPAGARIDSASGLFTWVPSFSQSGTHTITAVVFDAQGLTDTSRAVITVRDSNNVPVFTAVMPNSTVNEGQLLTFDYNATDVNGDTVRFALVAPAPAGAVIDQNSGLFMWTPTFAQSGTYNIIVSASDGHLTALDTAVVTVVNVNREPSFTTTLLDTTKIKYPVPATFTFQYAATDPDNDPLSFRLLNPPAGATITAAGLLSYSPSAAGLNVTFTVVVSDTAGGDDTTTVSLTTVVPVVELNVPTEYKLNQNYPNPFNPSTTIKFALPTESYVTLKVYNLLGQEVSTIVNEMLPAAYYEYKFDASKLGSGIYVYRIEAGKFVSTKKMLLVK